MNFAIQLPTKMSIELYPIEIDYHLSPIICNQILPIKLLSNCLLYCLLYCPIGDRVTAAGSWAGPGPGPDRLGLKCYLAWGGTRVVGGKRGGMLYQFSEKHT